MKKTGILLILLIISVKALNASTDSTDHSLAEVLSIPDQYHWFIMNGIIGDGGSYQGSPPNDKIREDKRKTQQKLLQTELNTKRMTFEQRNLKHYLFVGGLAGVAAGSIIFDDSIGGITGGSFVYMHVFNPYIGLGAGITGWGSITYSKYLNPFSGPEISGIQSNGGFVFSIMAGDLYNRDIAFLADLVLGFTVGIKMGMMIKNVYFKMAVNYQPSRTISSHIEAGYVFKLKGKVKKTLKN